MHSYHLLEILAIGFGLALVFGYLAQRVRLSLPRGSAPPEGSPVTQLARLLPPLGPAMPGAHDFGRKPWFEDIGAVGFALGRPRPARLDTPPPVSVKAAAMIAGVREALAARIRAVLSGPSADIAVALVTGERASIAPQVEDSMRQSGLTHVLSISGLHMAMVAGTLFALVRGGLALFPPLALAFPVKSMAAGVALLGSAGYLALSGNDEPAQRSFIMAAVVLLGIVLGRAALNLRTVAVAGVLVLALSPVSVLDPGTQMSFAATLALVADAQQAAPARTFWFAMQAFAGLAASGEGMGTLNVKQLFGLINLQLRRLAQGTSSLPEAMLRDALYFIAAAHAPTPQARQQRAAFALDGLVPADVEARRYGQVDQEALQGARAALAQARASWSRLAQADLDPALGDAVAAFRDFVLEEIQAIRKQQTEAVEGNDDPRNPSTSPG